MSQAMRNTTALALACAALAAGSTAALADPVVQGNANNSPGIASGNIRQRVTTIPVIACGVTANVIAALNPAFGNICNHLSTETDGDH